MHQCYSSGVEGDVPCVGVHEVLSEASAEHELWQKPFLLHGLRQHSHHVHILTLVSLVATGQGQAEREGRGGEREGEGGRDAMVA